MPQVIGMAVGGLLFGVGAPLALVNFFAIGAGGSLLFGLGLTLAANALLGGRPGGGPALKPSDGQQSIRQAVPPRMKSGGRVRLSGVVWWLEADSATGILHYGLALNQGRIGGFVDYHIDDATVTINGSGVVQEVPYNGVTTKILTRLGLPTETAYAEIESAFGYENVRGDGVATMLGIFENFLTADAQFENYPNGLPRLKVTIDGSVVWDPRDEGQDREDEATWESSENPIVHLLNYLLDPDGYAIAWSRIEANIAEWTAAMDACEVQVNSPAAGGSEDLYRVAFTYLLTDRPADVAARFLNICDGRCWQKRDGTIGISVGVFATPTVTIPSRHILAWQMTAGQDPLTAIAGVRAQYMSPAHDYREQEAEPWPDGETVMALGEDRVANLDLTWAPSHGQARRLSKRTAIRAASPWRGTIRTDLYGLLAMDERFINVEISMLDIAESFEVTSFKIDPGNNQCEIEIVAVGAEIDEWDPALEEGTAPLVPEGLVFIDKSLQAPITDFDTRASHLFDDNKTEGLSAAAQKSNATSGYAGFTLDTPKAFGKAVVYGSNNAGFERYTSSANPVTASVTINVRGKNGAAPSGPTNGTLLGTVTFTNLANEGPAGTGGRAIVSTDTVTLYDHIFVEFDTAAGDDGHMLCAEIDFWEFV